MNDWALYLGMAAMLCAACSLLCAGFARKWGVDPSREAPGTGKAGAGARLLRMQALSFAAMLPPALWMSAAIGEKLDARTGAAACAGFALLCALLGFLAIFTSVRHGAKGMDHVCEEELFARAGRVRSLLGLLAALLSAGAMLMSILRDGDASVTNGMLLVFSCMLWPMLSLHNSRCAEWIGNEHRMLSLASGGVVCAALIAMLALLPGARLALSVPVIILLFAGVRFAWAAAWMMLCLLGGEALHALTARPFPMKKRRLWPKVLLCMALSVPLALFAPGSLFVAAAALCALCMAMDIAACTMWLRRIGR